MSQIMKHAETVKKLATQFQALAELGPVLERIGSLEQAELEAKARQEAAYAKDAELQMALQAKQVKVAEAAKSLESVEKAAADLEAQAQEKASAIVSLAKEQADDLAKQANQKMFESDKAIDSNRRVLEAVKKDIASAESELAELEEKLVPLRAAVKALQG